LRFIYPSSSQGQDGFPQPNSLRCQLVPAQLQWWRVAMEDVTYTDNQQHNDCNLDKYRSHGLFDLARSPRGTTISIHMCQVPLPCSCQLNGVFIPSITAIPQKKKLYLYVSWWTCGGTYGGFAILYLWHFQRSAAFSTLLYGCSCFYGSGKCLKKTENYP